MAPGGLRRAFWSSLSAALVLVVVGVGGHIAWTLHRDRAEVTAGQAALREAWDADVGMALVAGRPAPGGPIGRMTIPRLDLSWVIVEGVNEQDITAAPGHYPGTAMPGQRGNFAVAGHREIGIFADLDDAREHDKIVVETRQRFYVYAVVSVLVTAPSDLAQVAPVPPGMRPGKLLTLTTCHPRWSNTQRLIVHAVLERTTPADDPPAELAGAEQ